MAAIGRSADDRRSFTRSNTGRARDQLDLLRVHHHRIFGPDLGIFDQYGWRQPRDVVGQARRFFDRIADECIEDQALIGSESPFLEALGRSHRRYQQLLAELDAIDFGGLQEQALSAAARRCAWLPVWEPIFTTSWWTSIRTPTVPSRRSSSGWRRRTATSAWWATRTSCCTVSAAPTPTGSVPSRRRFPDAATHRLDANYRSHRRIVDLCNRWITSFDWSNPSPDGAPFRHQKRIVPRAVHANDNHPGVVSVLGHDQADEGRQIAELLHLLKDQGFIGDFDQAAVLLPSVRERYSRRLAEALRGSGIPVHLVDGEDRPDHAGGGSAAGPHPSGHVLFTTIHQAKGREWPLVFVGGLHAADLRADGLEVELSPYLTRTANEPPDRGARYDLARQYFVAFSRAQRLLVITAQREPHAVFTLLWDAVPSWTSADLRLLSGTGKFAVPDRQPQSPAHGSLHLVVPSNATLILRPSSRGATRMEFTSQRRCRKAGNGP